MLMCVGGPLVSATLMCVGSRLVDATISSAAPAFAVVLEIITCGAVIVRKYDLVEKRSKELTNKLRSLIVCMSRGRACTIVRSV